jgi:hypothetical protein
VTRREYAELVVRLGSVELLAHRNRAVLDRQAQRIAQLEEQLRALQADALARSLPQKIPAAPASPPIPTVES